MSDSRPPALVAALDRLLEGRSRRTLAQRATRLSQAYRDGCGSQAVIRSADDVLAYLTARLPATHAAALAVMREVRARCAAFAPRSLLDAGAGPGTASWAAATCWPQIESIVMLDRNAPFLDVARELARAAAHPALAAARIVAADLNRLPALPQADLVVAGYLMAEMPADIGRLTQALWSLCSGVLVLAEPGTPEGHARILTARKILIAGGAIPLAPCPHARDCPIVPPDWCHFAVRVARSRDHMRAKGARLPYEDEKFSYFAAARPHVAFARYAARVLAPPRSGKAGLSMKLCADGDILSRTVARRERDAFAQSRHVRWGDAIE